MHGHVVADGLLDVALQLLVEHLALLDGQLALLHEIAQHALALFVGHGGGADAGQYQLADAFSQLIHDLSLLSRPADGYAYYVLSEARKSCRAGNFYRARPEKTKRRHILTTL